MAHPVFQAQKLEFLNLIYEIEKNILISNCNCR